MSPRPSEAEYTKENRGVSSHAMPISSCRRRLAADEVDSPGRGCPQHVFDHSPAEWYLPRARRWSSTSQVVEQENRKGPMQGALLVGAQLLFRSDLAIARIDQDDAFFGDRCDGQVMLRRQALSCVHSP